jgi:hypothetical protein
MEVRAVTYAMAINCVRVGIVQRMFRLLATLLGYLPLAGQLLVPYTSACIRWAPSPAPPTLATHNSLPWLPHSV